ncbi:MAG TPA: hypothetical protein VKY59_02150 [Spirillospora sp.]|nr:hypothetical protein [Spirillospora sp.]
MDIQHEVRTLTSGPAHHFFGYYSVCPWNQSQTHLVCLESPFQDHLPEPHEAGAIGLVDAQTGQFERVTETRAWNLQQGAWLYWNPLAADSEIIHNDREGSELVSVIYNLHTGQRRILPRPINALSQDGAYALCLTYGRLQRMRKVVGYAGAVDPNPNHPHPANDGVFLMDMRTGDVRLVVSIQQVYDILAPHHPVVRDNHMWFNHVAFNPSATRFYFLARCWKDGQMQTGAFTANRDGSDLRQVTPFGTRASHLDWRSDTEFAATFDVRGRGREHVLVNDNDGTFRFVAEGRLNFDGHMTFSPDRSWMVTDQNVAESLEKWLLLVRLADEEMTVLHQFPMHELRWLSGDLRCDLHPRWNRTGDTICVDALAADGTRQLHTIHLDLS